MRHRQGAVADLAQRYARAGAQRQRLRHRVDQEVMRRNQQADLRGADGNLLGTQRAAVFQRAQVRASGVDRVAGVERDILVGDERGRRARRRVDTWDYRAGQRDGERSASALLLHRFGEHQRERGAQGVLRDHEARRSDAWQQPLERQR